jgi:Protein of unknown function (DUF2971)
VNDRPQDDGSIFLKLFADLRREDEFFEKKPLLAHYTSVDTLEKIARFDQIWLSNPLFMNDFEEVRFGVNEGLDQVKSNDNLRNSIGSHENLNAFLQQYDSYYDQFADDHVVDTYVFCLCQHDENDNDGKLSMWRGYGASGSGACIVINSAKVPALENSPFIFAKVYYATREERKNKILEYVETICEIFRQTEPTVDQVRLGAYYLFERIKLFALFTKHWGFREEDEWRIVYLPNRDPQKLIEPMMDYWIGPKGIEPKLKLTLKDLPFGEQGVLSLSNITDRIIIGPSASSPLAIRMVKKMLKAVGRSELAERVVPSTIPFRNT